MTLGPRFLDANEDTAVLGVLRVALGVLLGVQSFLRLREVLSVGYFGEVFHLPLVPEAAVPSAGVYLALQGACLGAAALVVMGVRAREGLLFASSVGLYLLACDRLEYHNNRFALFLLSFLTAFTPCERSYLPFRRREAAGEHRFGPTWAVTLLRLQVSAIYLSSAGGKLLDADWRGGQTLLVRFQRGLELFEAQGHTVPGLVAGAYASPLFASLAAKAAITTELFVAVALFHRRARALALYAGVLFHLGIELSARVELFSYVMGAAYVAFVVPRTRERVVLLDVRSRAGRTLRRLLPFIDVLSRFRVEERPGPFGARDRGEGEVRGLAAAAVLARGLPILFPAWGPLWLAGRLASRPSAGRPQAREAS